MTRIVGFDLSYVFSAKLEDAKVKLRETEDDLVKALGGSSLLSLYIFISADFNLNFSEPDCIISLSHVCEHDSF